MSRKSYPNVNAANQYARDVVRGKIVACQFVIQACQRHLDDLMAEKSKSFRYRFDKDLAERAAKFIQLLPHTKGEWAFKRMPITLEPWQLFVICCAFGWVNKGTRLRRFREVYTEIPRKNGKSAISAGVALYCFACDNEFGAEVYSGATTEKQAWEVFRPARLMCKRTPMLTEAFGIEVNASNMNRPEDGARFEPLIGNPSFRIAKPAASPTTPRITRGFSSANFVNFSPNSPSHCVIFLASPENAPPIAARPLVAVTRLKYAERADTQILRCFVLKTFARRALFLARCC